MKTIANVIKSLMVHEPYYGIFACGLNKEWDEKISTAGVCLDGINYKLVINKEWWDKLDPNIRYGVIKHELLHLVFYHVLDYKDFFAYCPDRNILNIAMDLEVQSYIDPQFRWEESAAEKLFNKYPNLPRQMGTKFYINFLKQLQEYDPNSKSDFENIINGDYSGKELLNGNQDDHNNWGDTDSNTKELSRNQLDYQLKESAKQTIKARGTIPQELQESIEKLLKPLPPVFNWKAYFRRLLGISFDVFKKKTRRKESDRFEDSYGLKRKKKHRLLVAIDTSGSVSNPELVEFFNEIYHIWKAGADVHILECDSEITNEYDYTGKCPEQVTGRGGTSFLPCVDYYNEHSSNYNTMVYFTDGYGDQEECKPKHKMMWVITSNGNSNKSEFPGIVIKIPNNNK